MIKIPRIQGYLTGSELLQINDVTVSQSGTKTYLDVSLGNAEIVVNLRESTSFDAGGYVNIGSPASELTFSGTTQSIILSSKDTNDKNIFIGGSGVSSDGSNHFVVLGPGDDVNVDYNDVSNAFWAVSESGTQVLSKGALL